MSVEDFDEYQSGIQAAEKDIRNGNIDDLDAAISTFDYDHQIAHSNVAILGN